MPKTSATIARLDSEHDRSRSNNLR